MIYRNTKFLGLDISEIISIFILILTLVVILVIFIFGIGLNVILKNAPLLTIIILFISSIISVTNLKCHLNDKQLYNNLNYSNLIGSKISQLYTLFMNNNNLNRLYLDMYSIKEIQEIQEFQEFQEFQHRNQKINVTVEMIKAEHNMANIIFQTISDIYISENCKMSENDEDNIEWIITFKNWFKSKLLLKYWKNLKYEYHKDVQIFIDLLISESQSF